MSSKCSKCGRPSSHTVYSPKDGKHMLCCKCYVGVGNIPANWHPECMKAYKEKKNKVLQG